MAILINRPTISEFNSKHKKAVKIMRIIMLAFIVVGIIMLVLYLQADKAYKAFPAPRVSQTDYDANWHEWQRLETVALSYVVTMGVSFGLSLFLLWVSFLLSVVMKSAQKMQEKRAQQLGMTVEEMETAEKNMRRANMESYGAALKNYADQHDVSNNRQLFNDRRSAPMFTARDTLFAEQKERDLNSRESSIDPADPKSYASYSNKDTYSNHSDPAAQSGSDTYSSEKTKFCPECGHRNPINAKFCNHCGHTF